MRTLYQVLQISPDASPDIVRMAHRVLAAKFHPDNQDTGESQAFRDLNEAFEVLKNPGDRARYDAEMAAVPNQTACPPPGIPLDKILVDLAARVARNHIGHLTGSAEFIEGLKPSMLNGIRAGLITLQRRFGGVAR